MMPFELGMATVHNGQVLRDFSRAEHTMYMPATTQRWTAEAVRALPDDSNRYELIDGELLVTPAPRAPHQRAVGELYFRLRQYLDIERVGEVLSSPADIELEPESIVQPDIFVTPFVDGRPAPNWPDMKTLLLACEVLSPTTARYDRVTKRRFFSRTGVAEYWVVDLDARIVERSRPSDERFEVITDTLIWHPTGAATPFVLELPSFFAAIAGDR